MNIHQIQQKLLILAKEQNLGGLTLRKIGELVGEPNSPQKIKHHLDKLIEKGLLLVGADGKTLKAASGGLDEKSKIISLPIIGSANCGEATVCAEQKVEGYLKVSLKILGDNLKNKIADLFVLRAIGNSMNQANVKGKNIEEGDFVIVEKNQDTPANGDYVVSTIDGLANIKKFIFDQPNKQIILVSESSLDLPPIYIHQDDYSAYLVCGKVVEVIKKPDELI
jgi:repressor LexA